MILSLLLKALNLHSGPVLGRRYKNLLGGLSDDCLLSVIIVSTKVFSIDYGYI